MLRLLHHFFVLVKHRKDITDPESCDEIIEEHAVSCKTCIKRFKKTGWY